MNQSWMTFGGVFVAALALQNSFPLPSKFSRNPGRMTKTVTCFVDLEKAYDGVPREKLWGVLREDGADGRLLLAVK